MPPSISAPARSGGPSLEFADAHLWQTCHQLALELYRLSRDLPAQDPHRLVTRLRRAALEIADLMSRRPTPRAATTDDAASVRGTAPGIVAADERTRRLDRIDDQIAEALCLVVLARDLGHITASAASAVTARIAQVTRMVGELRGSQQARAEWLPPP